MAFTMNTWWWMLLTLVMPCTGWLFIDNSTGYNYINLSSPDNWSEYLPMRTLWFKLRLLERPEKGSTEVMLNLSDTTFSSTNMERIFALEGKGPTKFMVWGSAGLCLVSSRISSEYKLDLTGTPFRLAYNEPMSKAEGIRSYGNSSCSNGHKQCQGGCGGECGWCGWEWPTWEMPPMTAKLLVDDQELFDNAIPTFTPTPTPTSTVSALAESTTDLLWLWVGGGSLVVALLVVIALVFFARRCQRPRPTKVINVAHEIPTKEKSIQKSEELSTADRSASTSSAPLGNTVTSCSTSDYVPLNVELGRGSFGVVCKGIDRTGGFVAMKRVWRAEKTTEVNNEVNLLSTLDHKHIVCFRGVCWHDSYLYMVMELCGEGSLMQLLHSLGPFPMSLMQGYGRGIVKGMEYLHANGVIHGDVKPQNVLLTKDGHCKIADFGLARLVAHGLTSKESSSLMSSAGMSSAGMASAAHGSIMGTPRYMPPEGFRGTITTKSDVFSFGLTVLHLVTGVIPWAHMNFTNAWCVLFQLGTCPMLHPIDSKLPQTLQALIGDCIVINPEDRSTFEQLTTHDFFMTADITESLSNEVTSSSEDAASTLITKSHLLLDEKDNEQTSFSTITTSTGPDLL
uniref:Protein kinase domain-containing protein n=1 Tax=Eutreptiella gymnastica TaxID=73025 RepID=A0A7S1N6S7_9EUGL|mmetsp:Transcript_130478/g.225615  ORF Transcript_130478/g.225615 Transcript_130478/m.225615 type:complete len:623 (+) Transcript_130478:45-1913(+)